MYDAVLKFGAISDQKSRILTTLHLKPHEYLLATIHRAYNTDNHERISAILSAFRAAGEVIIFPVHPRTRQVIESHQLSIPKNVSVIDPVGYLDMLMLEKNARIILTDSGGIQKEAFFFQIPCLTLRTETEWVETVTSGWNRIVGIKTDNILEGIKSVNRPSCPPFPYFGDGYASKKIVRLL